jgi:small subunit ribosomal protein S6
MERQMSLSEDVIRHLTVKVEALEEGPSAQMRRRDDREERSERGFGGGFGGREGREGRDGGRGRREEAETEGAN